MMKLALLACLVAVVSAQLTLPETNEEEIKQILATQQGAQEFVQCVKLPKACQDTRATAIARLAPMLLRTQGRCKGIKGIKCTPADESNIRLVVNILSTRYNSLYNDLVRYLIRNA